jgi:hypothetical protein
MKQLVLALMVVSGLSQANASSLSLVNSVLDVDGAAINGTGAAGASVKIVQGDIVQIKTPDLSVASESGRIERKNVAIAIPFELPRNSKLVISAGRVNVALALKRGAIAKTNAELFTAGTQGVNIQAVDNGPKNQVSLIKLAGLSTACGAKGILRLNVSELLTAKDAKSNARVNGAVLRAQVVKCN